MNWRISETTEGLLLFLSGLKASLLFFLPDTSSFHNSDRHTRRIVRKPQCLITVDIIQRTLVMSPLSVLYLMWCQCCVGLPPAFLFSLPVHFALCRRVTASHSARTHRQILRWKLSLNHHANKAVMKKVRVSLTSQCWHAAWVSQSYLCLTDSRHSSL